MSRLASIIRLSASMLLLLGTVALFSSTTYRPKLERVYLHLGWIAAGVTCAALAARLNYAWLRRFRIPECAAGTALVLLVAVLVPGVGVMRNGAARWLPFGQPSEFAKFAIILFLADHGARNQGRMQERNAGFIWPRLVAGMAIALVFAEPDWGTATLIAVVSLAMLMIAGTHWGYLASATIAGAELFALLLLNNPLRLERFLAFLDPERSKAGVGWQGWHSVLALGSGGWFGTFFGEGSHKNGFVPEQQTDFILSLLGEETGFVGTALVLLLLVIIVLCGARIAWRVSDPFAQLLASGITVLIGVQALINIGVVTSSLPNKGIPLPLVSYGGSNLVCMLTCLGLLTSLARYGSVVTAEPMRAEFAARSWPKAGGPIGSLLDDSSGVEPRGLLRPLVRWRQARRRSRFPSVAAHPYQRPPYPFHPRSGAGPAPALRKKNRAWALSMMKARLAGLLCQKRIGTHGLQE